MIRKYLSVLVPALYPMIVAVFVVTAYLEKQEQTETAPRVNKAQVDTVPHATPIVEVADLAPAL